MPVFDAVVHAVRFSEHVSGALAKRKTERSGPKIGWNGEERGVGVTENDGAGAERGAETERGAG